MKYLSEKYRVFLKATPFLIVVLSLSLGTMGKSYAAPVIFFGEDLFPGATIPIGGLADTARNDFHGNLVGGGTEDFETYAGGDKPPYSITFAGAGTASLTGGNEIFTFPGAGRFATSGTNYFEATSGFTLIFDQPVAAFGFFGTDIGDFNGQITLALDNGQSLLVPNTVDGPDSSLLFFGIIDTATFSSVTFGNTNGFPPFTDVFGFDDMTVGSLQQLMPPNTDPGMTSTNPVPEPSTMILLGSGLAGILFWRRKIRIA